jgi:prephenate dehydrogenase
MNPMASDPFDRVAIVGCGLMGGSFALAMRQAQLAHKVVGYSPSERSRHLALELGVVDQAFDQLPLAIQGSDLVLVAVPVSHMRATFAAIAPHLSDNALVMDVGSTKSDVIEAAEQGLGHKLKQWLPCHPIAGKEKAGVDQAEASLYQNRPLILTPLGVNSPAQIKRATALWQALGSRVHLMDPNAHDQAFAAVSHLPHLLAFAYLLGLMDQADHLEWMDRAGPGFRDFSRIAASDPVIWRDILLANAEHVLTQSQHFSAALDTLSQAIRSGDAQALQSLIQRASEQRAQWHPEGF